MQRPAGNKPFECAEIPRMEWKETGRPVIDLASHRGNIHSRGSLERLLDGHACSAAMARTRSAETPQRSATASGAYSSAGNVRRGVSPHMSDAVFLVGGRKRRLHALSVKGRGSPSRDQKRSLPSASCISRPYWRVRIAVHQHGLFV